MKKISKAQACARKTLEEIGCDEVVDMPMDLLAAGLGAILIEESLNGYDGKIVFGKRKTIIKVDSKISYLPKKRFVIAHEIGHLLMHKNKYLPNDSVNDLSLFDEFEKVLKSGNQEIEANEFASELLMPEAAFLDETQGKRFSPLLIKELAERFKMSMTAVIYRYVTANLHPICCVFVTNGIVKYWKKSEDFQIWISNRSKLPPPLDSVAAEYIDANYDYLYDFEEAAQIIQKSTWFEIKENEEDSQFYEYCIPMKKYNSVLSIIWED